MNANISSLGCSRYTTAPSNRFADEPRHMGKTGLIKSAFHHIGLEDDGVAYPAVFQKAAFCDAKGRLLACKRWSFKVRKTAFCNAAGGHLECVDCQQIMI